MGAKPPRSQPNGNSTFPKRNKARIPSGAAHTKTSARQNIQQPAQVRQWHKDSAARTDEQQIPASWETPRFPTCRRRRTVPLGVGP